MGRRDFLVPDRQRDFYLRAGAEVLAGTGYHLTSWNDPDDGSLQVCSVARDVQSEGRNALGLVHVKHASCPDWTREDIYQMCLSEFRSELQRTIENQKKIDREEQ